MREQARQHGKVGAKHGQALVKHVDLFGFPALGALALHKRARVDEPRVVIFLHNLHVLGLQGVALVAVDAEGLFVNDEFAVDKAHLRGVVGGLAGCGERVS